MADKPSDKTDDLEAVRRIVESLQGFNSTDQERIIRWSREKLGLTSPHERPADEKLEKSTGGSGTDAHGSGGKDIKAFVAEKNPSGDNQFAATVAHYYRFVAPEANRKDAITADDLQEACRLTGRTRLGKPSQTLVNAHSAGLLNKGAERGTYTISTVGENLVAVALPSGSPVSRGPGNRATRKARTSTSHLKRQRAKGRK